MFFAVTQPILKEQKNYNTSTGIGRHRHLPEIFGVLQKKRQMQGLHLTL
jgi:hypothetical protein